MQVHLYTRIQVVFEALRHIFVKEKAHANKLLTTLESAIYSNYSKL